MYKLISENLSNLGYNMGLESTHSNYEKYFTKLSYAKEYAIKEHGSAFEWEEDSDRISSPAFVSVIYYIYKVKVEK